MKVKPGEEMLAAIEEAKNIGADVLLIDRDIAITFNRLWSEMGFFEKVKFFFHVFRSFFSNEKVDRLLEQDVVDSLVEEFRKISPKAAKVLIDERDEYMAANLLQAMQKYNKIVAVVGAGHKAGIIEAMNKRIDKSKLEEVRENKVFKVIALATFAFLLISFLLLFFLAGELILAEGLFYKIFLYWFLINGIFASLGALLARAHPISILSAFLCAWFTSLNPLIAAGWISGLVEAWMRRPEMKDLEELTKAKDFKELKRNKIFHILLVAALTNLGSMIGTIYAGYYILTNFGIDIAAVISEALSKLKIY